MEQAPVVTPAPVLDPANHGIVACCNPHQRECTIQPTACVDNDLHPASVLCKGTCPNDDMTLKCTATPGIQCKQIQMATPIEYVSRESDNGKLRRRDVEPSKQELATLNNIVRAWYCGLREVMTEVISVSKDISTYVGGHAVTESSNITISTATGKQSDGAGPSGTHYEEAHPTETHSGEACPTEAYDHPGQTTQPDSQLAAKPSPVDAGQGQPSSVHNAECEWIDDFGNCCDELEAASRNPPQIPAPVDDVECEWIDDFGNCCYESDLAHYSPRRLHRVRRSGEDDEDRGTGLSPPPPSASSGALIITHTHSLTATNRLLVASIPTGAPNMTIFEAVYIVDNTYKNQTDRPPVSEGDTFWKVVPYTDANKATSAISPKTPRPRPHRPHMEGSGANPNIGLKAGVPVAVIAFLVILGFALYYGRRRLSAKRARSDRDSEAGPTRSRVP